MASRTMLSSQNIEIGCAQAFGTLCRNKRYCGQGHGLGPKPRGIGYKECSSLAHVI